MSTYPNPKKVYVAPLVTKIDARNTPYSELIDILRSTLSKADKDVSLNPQDPEAIELQRSIRRMLGDLESKTAHTAA